LQKREIDTIGTLTVYSFITRQQEDTALDLYQLVYLAIQNWLRKEDQLAKWTEKVIMQLEDIFPNDSYKNRGLWRTYLLHARLVLQSDVVDKDWEPRIDLL
jgi:hypothetical protein